MRGGSLSVQSKQAVGKQQERVTVIMLNWPTNRQSFCFDSFTETKGWIQSCQLKENFPAKFLIFFSLPDKNFTYSIFTISLIKIMQAHFFYYMLLW